MSDSELREELDHHQAMLQQYKKNLRQIERSAASFSPTQIPLSIQNEINAENKRIAERKQLILETQQAIESVDSQRFRSNWHSKQKPIRHYLLFWHNGPEGWAARDWSAAQEYIGLFTPTCGFSALEAVYADKVTIIGATDGIAADIDQFLLDAGCQIERLDGSSYENTATLLRARVTERIAFVGGLHRLGY